VWIPAEIEAGFPILRAMSPYERTWSTAVDVTDPQQDHYPAGWSGTVLDGVLEYVSEDMLDALVFEQEQLRETHAGRVEGERTA